MDDQAAAARLCDAIDRDAYFFFIDMIMWEKVSRHQRCTGSVQKLSVDSDDMLFVMISVWMMFAVLVCG